MKTILVPVDFSDITPRVVEIARQFATALGSRLVLLHVSEPEPDFVGFEPGPIAMRETVARDLRVEHQKLETLKASCDLPDILALHIQGPAIAKILHEATAQDAAMIVLGSHGHGAFYELLVGSVTHGVLKGATCPVLVVPAASSSVSSS
jgi:nucleotide-binding universal stress UspA family protein